MTTGTRAGAGGSDVHDPAPADLRRADSGAAATLGLVGGGLLVAAVVPVAANYLFPVAAVLLAVVLLGRGRDVAVWELTIWLYLLAPLVRRVVDWRGGFHENSPVLLAAPAVALLGLLALQRTRPLRPAAAAAFGAALLAAGYAVGLGLLLRPPVPVAVAVLQWVSPLAVALLVLLGPGDAQDVRTAVRRVTRWGLLLLGGYGLVQYFVLPPWDAAWMESVRFVLTSIGNPEPQQVRVFSTSNAPGPLATSLGVLILLALGSRRTRLDDLALGLGFLTFGLSLVRAAWVSLAVAVVLLVLSRRVSLVKLAGSAAALVAVVALVGGPVAETISGRIDDTASAGTEDTSFQARLAFQAAVLPEALRDPFGAGLGSTGTAVRRGATGRDLAFQDSDSGYVEALHVFGAPLAVALLGTVFWAAASTWRRALAAPPGARPYEMVLAATLVTVPVAMLFGSALTAASGALFWSVLALTARADEGEVAGAR